MSKKRVLLIDGDIICYRIAAICEDRSVNVLHKKSNKSKVFKTRTEFKDFLSTKQLEYTPSDYEITDQQTINEDMDYGFLLSNQIKAMTENLWPDTVEVYLDGGDNFRQKLPLPTQYKSSRSTQLTPLLRKTCKDYLVRKHGAVLVRGCEVDDVVIYKGYEYLNQGCDVIIGTADKDSHSYSGLSLYNFTHDKPEVVKIPELGELYIDDKDNVRGYGFIFYCLQLAIGDKIDGFRPTELCGVKYGEKSAYKALKDCTSEQEALQIVISLYRKWYPKPLTYVDCFGVTQYSTWKDLISLYHQCVRMKATKDDALVFNDFAKQYGVDLDNYNDEGEP
jgi:hypothetical protein